MAAPLPNLIIAGVHKAGTTSLFTWLAQHPAISAAARKELHYYTPIRYGKNTAPIADYLAHFVANPDARYYLEASPSYLYGGPKLLNRMNSDLGDFRAIVILREPVARFVSFYKHLKANLSLPETMTFPAFVAGCKQGMQQELAEDTYFYRGLREGFYAPHLQLWQQQLGNRLHLIWFDDLQSDPLAVMHGICRWLELDPGAYTAESLGHENATTHYGNRALHGVAVKANKTFERFFRKNHGIKKAIRSVYYGLNKGKLEEAISDELLAELRQLYQPTNRELAQLIGKDLPPWLR